MQRVLLTCLSALVFAAPAQAQDPHPQVDPDSPAGSEYQLPIDRAREQARERPDAPGTAEGRGSTGEVPLFGSGVQSRRKEHKTPRASSAKADRDRDPARSAQLEPGLGTSTPEVRAQAPSPDDGGSGLVAIGGGALGVLLLGGLAGLAWRCRSVRR